MLVLFFIMAFLGGSRANVYEVGGSDGWSTNVSSWASSGRIFQVGDTLGNFNLLIILIWLRTTVMLQSVVKNTIRIPVNTFVWWKNNLQFSATIPTLTVCSKSTEMITGCAFHCHHWPHTKLGKTLSLWLIREKYISLVEMQGTVLLERNSKSKSIIQVLPRSPTILITPTTQLDQQLAMLQLVSLLPGAWQLPCLGSCYIYLLHLPFSKSISSTLGRFSKK